MIQADETYNGKTFSQQIILGCLVTPLGECVMVCFMIYGYHF